MWFIQSEMFVRVILALLLYVVGLLAASKLKLTGYFKYFSILLNLFVLFGASRELCAFYTGYVIFTYLFVHGLYKLKKARRFCFVLFCLLFVSPFFAFRLINFSGLVGEGFLLIGFSYNMLKAVDALFYTYYAEEKITFSDYANFILFFPVFTAGPIFRYRDFAAAFTSIKPLTFEHFEYGIYRFIIGMFKKVVLVSVLVRVLNHCFALPEFHWYSSLFIIILAYLLLYLDLSGYSDMAVGIGRLASVTVPENFKQPWTAASFTQFWRKWHVTLSDWIREHIFVVVQGKKLNKYLSAAIGMMTMLIMALWHDFSLTIIISGLYMGTFLAIENIFSLSTFNKRKSKKWVYVLRCTVVSFLFAVNALLYYTELDVIVSVVKGLVR